MESTLPRGVSATVDYTTDLALPKTSMDFTSLFSIIDYAPNSATIY